MLKQSAEGVIVPIKVIPKSSQSTLVGWESDELKVRLAAVPDKGQANTELIHFMAKFFNISKSQIKLISGQTSRHKRLLIVGMSFQEISIKLGCGC